MADRPTAFGKYFLLERINVGGMAEVYRAKTLGVEGFEKIVAIKRILPSVAEDEEFIRMFVDEAKITSQLSHANLAQTFDLGKIDDTYYIAMEYVPGKDLRSVFERLKRRGDRMPLPLAAWVVSRVCEGLDYAHRKRDTAGRELHIVHRDVSPQNVVLSWEGEVKLIDFGIAKAANKITRTQAGILKGKFGYMSPEQVRGLPIDGRSDIFAAGVVLYELCAGERLFTGSSDFSVLEKVQQARVTPPSQLDPSIPLRLERIILKALAREAAERYQQAADLAGDLTRFLLDTQARSVTREDVAAFMKATFPEDERREAEAPPRRPPPRIEEPVRKPAPRIEEAERRPRPGRGEPPLPASLTAELDPETTDPGRGPSAPGERAEIIVRSKLPRPFPAGAAEPGDCPTRPMSMDELAAAERQHALRERLAPPLPSPEGTPAPAAPEAPGEPEEPTTTPVERPRRAPPGPAPAAGEVRLEDQKTQVRRAPAAPPPPAASGQAGSGPGLRARWLRGIQIGIIVAASGVAAWALLSTPPAREREAAAATRPLDLSPAPAGAPPLPAPAGDDLTVLSSPPGALVWLDGEKKGVTPAYLATLDAAEPHAVSVEKGCYRSWQVALPAHAGRRQLAATLQPLRGACPGSPLETAGMQPPAGLPDDVAAAAALGFLNLGSHPPAQVVIDGVDIGQVTPLLAWPLHGGTHRLRLVAPGRSKEVAVDIRAGETRAEIVELAAAPKKRRARR